MRYANTILLGTLAFNLLLDHFFLVEGLPFVNGLKPSACCSYCFRRYWEGVEASGGRVSIRFYNLFITFLVGRVPSPIFRKPGKQHILDYRLPDQGADVLRVRFHLPVEEVVRHRALIQDMGCSGNDFCQPSHRPRCFYISSAPNRPIMPCIFRD